MKFSKKIKLIASDLDGTLKHLNQDFTEEDLKALCSLGENGVVRVIATGRSQYFAREILADDFPIDYLIFSSGAGIIRWIDKKLIFCKNIPQTQVQDITEVLRRNSLNFMLHKAVPTEHLFYYQHNITTNSAAEEDYLRRLQRHSIWGQSMPKIVSEECAQFLCFIENDLTLFRDIASQFTDVKVIRTTSPTIPPIKEQDGVIWIEIFEKNVSKGAAVQWLCQQLNIAQNTTAGLGNDYNDIDLLENVAFSWVVENAPDDLKQRFHVCSNLSTLILQE